MTMSNTLSKIIIFTAGAAIGSVITWKVVENKWKKIAEDEIESMREYFIKKYQKEESAEETKESKEIEDLNSAKKAITSKHHEERLAGLEKAREIVTNMGYSDQSNINAEREGDYMIQPYVIKDPDDFGETGYEMVTMVYYEGNNVLEEDFEGPIPEDEIDDLVGEDFASHFGENPDDPDTVYIRNDSKKIDYEIRKDYGFYEG